MYRVLLGIDRDEDRALAQADAIAAIPADEEVTAHLCHVFRDNPEGASVNQLSAVRRARARLEDAGITCTHYEASGEPASELIAAAEAVDADAICLSGRKRTPTGKAVFGSVTQEVILSSDRPVFAIPIRDE
ncbi:universal stress protein [Halorubrum sp. DTA98]|uniref:universal stress protein n=1 Tax=Halorubrum sp. DTA98 TaxID=3402163 RepID=UPI003AAEA66D